MDKKSNTRLVAVLHMNRYRLRLLAALSIAAALVAIIRQLTPTDTSGYAVLSNVFNFLLFACLGSAIAVIAFLLRSTRQTRKQ